MGVKVTNNAFGTLSGGINSTATTVTVDSGQGARFPTLGGSDFFFATLIDTSNNLEIIKVTARSSDSMTVVRGQDNTSARSFSIGDRIELRPTAALFDQLITDISNAGVAGISSSADATAMTIDSSERVGIGETSPTSALHVKGGAGANIAIQSTAGAHWRIGDAVGSSNGILVIRDHTNSANRIEILANGKTQIAQGVTFGSDTADANTLDDYEEGTWTATMIGSAANPSSSVTQNGNYIKIGLQVYVTVAFANVNTAGASGEIRITGLPFTPSPGNQMTGDVTFHSMHLSNATDRISNISPFFTSGYIVFYGSSSGNAWSGVQHTSGGYNGGYLYFTGTYLTT